MVAPEILWGEVPVILVMANGGSFLGLCRWRHQLLPLLLVLCLSHNNTSSQYIYSSGVHLILYCAMVNRCIWVTCTLHVSCPEGQLDTLMYLYFMSCYYILICYMLVAHVLTVFFPRHVNMSVGQEVERHTIILTSSFSPCSWLGRCCLDVIVMCLEVEKYIHTAL